MNFNIAFKGPIGPQHVSRFRLEQGVVLGFEAWWTGSHSLVVAEHFARDVVFMNHCPRHLSAFGGVHVGHAAVIEGFRLFVAEFHVTEPCITNILTDGFHVAASYSVRLQHVGTGRSGRVAGMAHVTVDPDHKIKKIENFFDNAAMAEIGEMLEAFSARSEALDRAKMSSPARRWNSPGPAI